LFADTPHLEQSLRMQTKCLNVDFQLHQSLSGHTITLITQKNLWDFLLVITR